MSDLFNIYDGVIFVANVRYREHEFIQNPVRVILASVSDRNKVFCIENPPYIDEIAKALQPRAGIPNGVSCWFESAQMKHYQKLGEKQNAIAVTESVLASVGVQNRKDFVFLSTVCKIRTLMIHDYVFIEEDDWSPNTENEKKLEENDVYQIDPELTRVTWRLARKVEKLHMRNC